MAVVIQFTTVVIRIDRLVAAVPDGVARITARWSPSWRDEHLLAVAFMDMGARDLAGELEEMGLTLRDTASGTRVWRDICVVDYYDGPTNPCDWLEYDPARHVAWLRGTDPGELAGPEHRHEEAPVRMSPEQLQSSVQRQTAAPVPSHEDRLLPRTRRIAAELLRLIPTSAKVEAVIFIAHFPRPGQSVHAGLLLHDLAGELRAFRLDRLTDEAHRLLTECSLYPSGQRLTRIEIKIAADGETTTRFDIGPPLSSEELQAHMDRLYGNVPGAHPPTLPATGCLLGVVRAIFGPRLELYPPLALRHQPQREPLSLLLDELDGIDEGWDRAPLPAAAAAAAAKPPVPAFTLDELLALEATRIPRPPRADGAPHPVPTGPAPVPGQHLTVPAAEGVLFAEARDFRPIPLSKLHRSRPALRFDPIHECLYRDLGPDLGELRFGAWKGNLSRIDLKRDGLPDLDAMLEHLQPVLVALGGLGPVVCALGAPEPTQIREAIPVELAEVRAALVPDSPHGRRVYPCWLLGAPPHTRGRLDLGVGLPDGRPSFGYTVSITAI